MSTDVITNSEKYENYREQMGRLAKAMKSQFYLEAIFIEYAVIEDRATSILRCTNDFNAEKHKTIVKKLNKLEAIQRDKNGVLRKYISEELISEIHEWKNGRNALIHALLNQTVSTDELKTFAEKGQELAKTLSSKATSYKRYLEHNPIIDKTLTAEQKKIFIEITDKGVLKKIDMEYVTKNNITELVIPDFVKKLANNVFKGLTTVKSLKIGMLLNDFGSWNLCELSQLEEVSVHEKNKNYMAADGVLYKKDKQEISFEYYPKQKKNGEYIVPDFVTEFGSGICNHHLTSLILPETVKRVSCFGLDLNNCPNLEKIVFPESLENSCCISLEQTRWYKENEDDFIVLGGILVRYKGNESKVMIPDNVKFIEETSFGHNEDIRSITIPASVTYMSGCEIFCGLECLEEIVILSPDVDADSPLLSHVNSNRCDFSRVYLPSKEVFYRLFSLDWTEYWCEKQKLPEIYIDGVCYDLYEIAELFSKNEKEIVINYNQIAEYYEERKENWLEEIRIKKRVVPDEEETITFGPRGFGTLSDFEAILGDVFLCEETPDEM